MKSKYLRRIVDREVIAFAFALRMDEFDPTDCGPAWRLRDETLAHQIRAIAMNRFGGKGVACWVNFDQCPIAGSMTRAFQHCEAWIDRRLSLEYVREFKIGITSDPIRRWSHEPEKDDRLEGYRTLGFHSIHMLMSSQRPGIVGPLEIKLLEKYRWDDHERKCQRPGHHLCSNRRRGGEGADFGPGPYYVYVAWKFNPGAVELLRQNC